MKRRHFISTASIAVPVAAAGILSCKTGPGDTKKSETSDTGLFSDSLVGKAMNAMLCMQRMAWEQGTASQALIAVGKTDLATLFARDAVVRQDGAGRLGILGNDPGITDPASNGEAVLLAWKETGDEKYRKAADAMYKFLKNTTHKTKDGVLHHMNYGRLIWSDSSFMAAPFLAHMGDFDEAVQQIEGFRKYLMDPEKKLYHHQWDEEKMDFSRKELWGGGNGWTAAGIAKIMDLLPAERKDLYDKLAAYGKEVIDGCLTYMRPDGLFHDVVNDSNSFVETNLSQMLAFAIYTGVKTGWLNASYKEKADVMRLAARSKIDSDGIVQGACGSPFFNKPGTSTEAQAFFLMMESALYALNSDR
jgi:rhamnogalacturonyl hydrolase YesR